MISNLPSAAASYYFLVGLAHNCVRAQTTYKSKKSEKFKMTKFNIAIGSDSVCPWCYIGKQKLDKAIQRFKTMYPNSGDEFSIIWKPFYLNPDSPKIGVDKTAYYKRKFGEERTQMMFQRLSRIGEDVGIDFKFGGKTGNTRDSHRIIQLAKSKSTEMQTKVVEELFIAYFEQGDITSHAVLRSAALRAGLQEQEIDAWLESDKGGDIVDREVEEAVSMQISGVPTFTLQDKYEVGGAQEPEVFVRLIEKIRMTEIGAKA